MARQTALVTGASSGIGLELAQLLAAGGYDLVLVARSEGKLQELAVELEKRHQIDAHVIGTDLAVPNAAADLAAELSRRAAVIDVLVNNAGYGLVGPFVETDLQRELDMIQVNIVALVQLTKLLLPGMVSRKGGRVLNVASTAAFQPGPLMAIYYATKAFVLSFSEAIAEELRGSGVTVTALCPGPTETGFASVANMTRSRLFTMTKPMPAAKVARIGYAGMMAGRRIVIPGVRNRVMMESLRVSPRSLVTKLVRKFQENR